MRCQKPNFNVRKCAILSFFHYRTGTMPVISIKWLVTPKCYIYLKSPWSRDYHVPKKQFFWISIFAEMRTFHVMIVYFSICPGFTRKQHWKNSSFQYVVQMDMVNNFCSRTDLRFTFVWATEFFEVQWLIIEKCL